MSCVIPNHGLSTFGIISLMLKEEKDKIKCDPKVSCIVFLDVNKSFRTKCACTSSDEKYHFITCVLACVYYVIHEY